MTIYCFVAITLAASALIVASYPCLHDYWEKHSSRARWRRRLAEIKAL